MFFNHTQVQMMIICCIERSRRLREKIFRQVVMISLEIISDKLWGDMMSEHWQENYNY